MGRKSLRGLPGAVVAAVLCAGTARAQAAGQAQQPAQAQVSQAQPPQAQSSQMSDVVVRPGDVVNVVIWREPDLSGAFPVNETGRVVLPLLGERLVGGTSAGDVQRMLERDYSAQLRNPSINVTLLRRVNVLGEVTKPGLYNVDPTITLAGVIALAGGTTPSGDMRRVQLIRGGRVLLSASPETRLASVDVRSDDQVLVGRRSWFDRNSGVVVGSLLSAALSVVTTLIITRK
jgi:polysaccharide export outer membrane protein